MNQTLLKTTFLSIFLYLTDQISAQVTIGSQEEPNIGALLDMKEYNASTPGGATATKGLNLPRVRLIKKSDKDIAKTIEGLAPKAYGTDDHTGLVVFNIPKPTICPIFERAPYVWTGTEWQLLLTIKKETKSRFEINSDGVTGTLYDFEENDYTVKRYQNASTSYDKWWMTQNLRSLRLPDGEPIGCKYGSVRLSPALFHESGGAIDMEIPAPNGIIGDYTNAGVFTSGQTYSEFIYEFGLTYKWDQANNACPAGWHLPSAQEWTDLLIAMGGIADNDASEPNDRYKGIGNAMRKNQGKVYKSADNNELIWGPNGTYTPNGFNAVPAGRVTTGTLNACDFGYKSEWWTSSVNVDPAKQDQAMYRLMYNNRDRVDTNGAGQSIYFAVRCVKD